LLCGVEGPACGKATVRNAKIELSADPKGLHNHHLLLGVVAFSGRAGASTRRSGAVQVGAARPVRSVTTQVARPGPIQSPDVARRSEFQSGGCIGRSGSHKIDSVFVRGHGRASAASCVVPTAIGVGSRGEMRNKPVSSHCPSKTMSPCTPLAMSLARHQHFREDFHVHLPRPTC